MTLVEALAAGTPVIGLARGERSTSSGRVRTDCSSSGPSLRPFAMRWNASLRLAGTRPPSPSSLLVLAAGYSFGACAR